MGDGSDRLLAAVAAGVLSADEEYGRLLRSVVEVARAIFGARGSSVFLYEQETDELVFAAVAGDAEQHLLGRRMPSSSGIAGWVLAAGTPLILEDVTSDPRFARDVAEETGYVPKGLMAVPLLDEEHALGVLQVLDRPQRSRFSMQEMDLLSLFANQATIALRLLGTARRARAVLEETGDGLAVAHLAAAFERLHGERREAAHRLLADLTRILA
jgi:GAF domain-containing protein